MSENQLPKPLTDDQKIRMPTLRKMYNEAVEMLTASVESQVDAELQLDRVITNKNNLEGECHKLAETIYKMEEEKKYADRNRLVAMVHAFYVAFDNPKLAAFTLTVEEMHFLLSQALPSTMPISPLSELIGKQADYITTMADTYTKQGKL